MTKTIVLKCLNITPILLSSTAWPISSAHHLNAGGPHPPFLHTYALSSDRVSFSFPSICTSGTPPFNHVLPLQNATQNSGIVFIILCLTLY